MANETTTTTLDDTVYAKELEREYQRELRPHRFFRNFLRKRTEGNSARYSFTTIDDSGSTLTSVGAGESDGTFDTAEAATEMMSNLTAIATTGAIATASAKACAALVSHLAIKVSIIDVAPLVGKVLADQASERYDIDAQATIDDFSNTTGGATTNTISRMLTVISALEQRDVGSRGEHLVGGIHPKQLGDLRADVVGLASTFLAGNDARVGGILMNSMDGYVGDPFGVPLFHSTSISNTGGAHQGWIMAEGSAVGAYEIWMDRLRKQVDESKLADELIASNVYGFALIDNNRLQGWRSTT